MGVEIRNTDSTLKSKLKLLNIGSQVEIDY